MENVLQSSRCEGTDLKNTRVVIILGRGRLHHSCQRSSTEAQVKKRNKVASIRCWRRICDASSVCWVVTAQNTHKAPRV